MKFQPIYKVEHHYYIGNWKKKVILSCENCSLDTELWPKGSIDVYEQSYKEGHFFCECNPTTAPHWKPFQYLILCSRELKPKGMEVLPDSYYESRRKNTVHIKSHITGLEFYYSVDNILQGKLPKKEKGQRVTLKWASNAKDELQKVCQDIVIIDVKSKHEVSYSCIECSKDIFTLKGLCNGVFKSNYHAIKIGKRCCRCTDSSLTKEQQRYKLTTMLTEDGNFLVKFPTNYQTLNTNFTWACKEGHLNSNSIRSYYANRSCRNCANYGIKLSEPTTFYLSSWTDADGQEVLLKYGITNRLAETRKAEQQRGTELKGTLLLETRENDGVSLAEFEQKLKRIFKDCRAPVELFKDGYSETVYYSTVKGQLESLANLKGGCYDNIIEYLFGRIKAKTD
ncbi:hypothetical protein NVP1161O_167 [Vibrio phage 1.161.O._10N.261.48.C5]|nr:hypothetical protein NVP1161O_167 [Vibrio phage 1.161.O._10N.261.48.C5]